MEKIKEYKGIIILILILILGVFYWFQLRPNSIRKGCWDKVEMAQSGDVPNEGEFVPGSIAEKFVPKMDKQKVIDEIYDNCLRENGLD